MTGLPRKRSGDAAMVRKKWVQLGSIARRLKEASCKRIYEDTASGAKADRPNLIRMLDKLHTGDFVVVLKLARLARSLHDLLLIIERIGKIGAACRSLTEPFDTSTALGRAMMQMIGMFACHDSRTNQDRVRRGEPHRPQAWTALQAV